MGSNAAFIRFETSVIQLYNQGKLTQEILDAIAHQHRSTVVDLVGDRALLTTKDGKGLTQICVETISGREIPLHENIMLSFFTIIHYRWG